MFLLLSRYVKPESEVDAHLEAHRAFLDRQYAAGRFIVSGPCVPRIGGVIVTADMSREELDAIMQEDPFAREGVSEYQVIEFTATKRAQGFLSALETNR